MKPRLNPYQAAPEAMKSIGALELYVQSSGIEPSLIELVKIRASQINGCAYCIHMHTRDARVRGEAEERIYLLDAWRESPLYSERERAALTWTEAVTLVSQTHVPDAVYDETRRQFSEEELVKLTVAVATINAWNRIAISFRSVHPVKTAISQGSPVIDKGGSTMKIVVIGGTGLIGSKSVAILRQGGHEVVAASPNSGINTITGEGLKEAMAGTRVVIDLANSPSFEDQAVLEFFETSGRNLLAAEAAADVRHHVALSIVGTDRTPDNGYFRAKVAQEKLIEASGIPYTIIRSTQFLEFLGRIAAESADGNMVRLSPGLFQPIAADDVAAIVADVALAAPRNGIVEIAGPERAPFNEIVARYLKAVGDPREVVRDPEARYWGGRVEERSLVPLADARLGRIGLDEWLRRSQAKA